MWVLPRRPAWLFPACHRRLAFLLFGIVYGKIFTQIFDSSIREKPEVRFTFMDMLVLADIDGVVDMTHEAIAARTNRPLELIRETIAELEGPDPKSRTPDHQGKRIVRLDNHRDWGWMIVNYERFRKTASEEQRREKTRNRVAKFRSKTHKKEACNAPVTPANACNAMQRQKQMERQKEGETEFPPLIGSGGIGVSERITLEKSLDRISKRLVELKDADLGRAPEERRELKAEKSKILGVLGLKA